MKLVFAPPSPYARKARMVVIEKGLADRVELTAHNPFEESEKVCALNPIGKIPILVTDEGDILYDSPVVCEYLDSLSPSPRLFPSDGKARWTALRRQALSDAILDAAVSIVLESRFRAEGERSRAWVERCMKAIERGLDSIEKEIDAFPAEVDIAILSLVAAADFLDFRLKDSVDWRNGRPKLKAFYVKHAARDSVQATKPPGL